MKYFLCPKNLVNLLPEEVMLPSRAFLRPFLFNQLTNQPQYSNQQPLVTLFGGFSNPINHRKYGCIPWAEATVKLKILGLLKPPGIQKKT